MGVLVATAGLGARALMLGGASPGLRVMNDHGREIIEALGELLWPEGNPVGPSWRDVDLPARVDALLAEVIDPGAAEGFRYLLRGLDYACLASQGTRFCVAPLDQRAALLDAWEQSLAGRMGHAAIKSVLGMAYFNAPEVLDALGFASRCEPGRAAR